VVIRGAVVPGGILRVEQVGGTRTFQTDEMTSAAFLANLAALALELERSIGAEDAVRSERAVMTAALDASGAAVLVLDQSGNVLHWNERLLALFGMHETLMGPAGNGGVRIQHIAERTTDPARFIARFRRVSAEPEGDTEDVVELTDGRRVVRASRPLPGGGGRAWSFRVVSAPSERD
jgi:PAS domain-containing protein